MSPFEQKMKQCVKKIARKIKVKLNLVMALVKSQEKVGGYQNYFHVFCQRLLVFSLVFHHGHGVAVLAQFRHKQMSEHLDAHLAKYLLFIPILNIFE